MEEYASSLNRESRKSVGSFQKQKPTIKPNFLSKLNKIWQYLIAVLTKQNELQVKQKSDRFGNTWWNAYDPATGESVSFGSETEMLIWIEQRYYR